VQRYERFLKEGIKMRKSLQDCWILAKFAPVNIIYSLKGGIKLWEFSAEPSETMMSLTDFLLYKIYSYS
jgi:hypothetical protein